VGSTRPVSGSEYKVDPELDPTSIVRCEVTPLEKVTE
jgi:hypothetical protein